jgi:hypothetical protein
MEEINQLKRDKKALVKIVEQVKHLIPHPDSYKLDEDVCCVCLDYFKKDQKLVFLPCNSNHIFHHHCISEWLPVNQQ